MDLATLKAQISLATDIPLQIQSFGSFNHQTLVALHIASLRASNKTASATEVRDTFIALRVPPPKNVHQHLAKLASNKLILSPSNGRWAITPLGGERIRQLMTGVTDSDFDNLLTDKQAALFADTPHSLLPPEMAPVQFRAGIGRFLKGHPFDSNVFGISRFPRKEVADDPIVTALDKCRAVCSELGLEYHLASDRAVEELLFSNVVAALWACRYGIAIIEDTVAEGPNYNVALEVGAMLVTGRPCLILKDHSVKRPPSDLIAHIYDEVEVRVPASIEAAIRGWAADRLGLH